MSLLGQQPGLERPSAAYGQAFEQLGTQTGERDGVTPGPVRHDVDVDDGIGRELQHDGIAVDGSAVAEPASYLGQAPAQSTYGLVGATGYAWAAQQVDGKAHLVPRRPPVRSDRIRNSH